MNPNLLTALGTLGAGFSAYGQEKQRRDALSRALEEQQFERSRLQEQDRLRNEAIQRDIEESQYNRTRQGQRDVLDAIMGGLRPQGATGPLTIGGRTFELPPILTPEEKIAERKLRFKAAYPGISDGQAELLARGEIRPEQVIVRPQPPRRTTTGFGTPPQNSPRSLWQVEFGGVDTKGNGLPR